MPTIQTPSSRLHEVQTQWLQLAPEVRAFYAQPEGASPRGVVVVLMEAFGLNDHMQDVARRVAAQGYAAIVPDLYHGKLFNYDDIKANPNPVMDFLKSRDDATALREIGWAIDAAEARPEVIKGRAVALGFCMGGRYAYLSAAALGKRLAGAICFYGGGIGTKQDRFGRKPPVERTAEITAPIMLMYGAEDKSIPPEEHAHIAEALSAAKKRFSLNVFPKAGHGFFSDPRESYEPVAAKEAWELTLNFLEHVNR